MTGGVGAQRVSSVVKPGEQASLEYQFRPDSMLQVREFQVAVHVFYQVSPPPPPSLSHLRPVQRVSLPASLAAHLQVWG